MDGSARTATRRNATHRWIRQLHLWIGAWGALAAVLYGFTGLVMNHRFGDGAWPRGESAETGRVLLEVPPSARETPTALRAWLRTMHALETQVVRASPPGAVKPGAPGVAGHAQPIRWNLSGGDASASWSLEYIPGNHTAEVKRNRHSLLAAFGRLHKGVGGGWAWTLLADSFAIGMLLLGLSGLWMWARGRNPRQLIVSVLGVSLLGLLAVLGPALL
jgi:hypothetical protein